VTPRAPHTRSQATSAQRRKRASSVIRPHDRREALEAAQQVGKVLVDAMRDAHRRRQRVGSGNAGGGQGEKREQHTPGRHRRVPQEPSATKTTM
jgi:hypothetical protein